MESALNERDRVTVCVLGPLTTDNGEDERPVGALQRRQVLAVLATYRQRGATIDELIDVIWNDDPPTSARKAVQVHIHHLRKDLDIPIESTDDGYRLRAKSTDAERFEALVRAAREDDDPRQAAEQFAAARSMWRGPAFDGVDGLEPVDAERARLEELRAIADEGWYDARLRTGAATDLIPSIEQSVRQHPYRDRFRQQLMLALHRGGRQREALSVFQAYRSELGDAGLEPAPATAELERQIATNDPALAVQQRSLRSYTILDRLGEGAFSIVYRGHQPSVDREVAIKQIRSDLANRPEFIRRFEAEARMVAALEHPHIVPLIDYWREPGAAYLVMRLLRGGSLETAVSRGAWEPDATARMAVQIASALAAAHRAGVVHRDVKPANILLDPDGWAYLTDFGIALESDEAHDPESALSTGSPAYASPEQLRHESVGPAADVHGLAIAVFETLTGHLPFPDEPTQAAALRRQLEDPIPLLRTIRPELRAVDEILQHATAKNPADRYTSVEEFAEDLSAALSPRAVPATVPTSRGTVLELDDRNPYKGLRAFEESDAADFAGRSRLVDRFVQTLRSNRALTVVGPSGSGKSSAVRAGLLPAIRSGVIDGSSSWFIATMIPGEHPYEQLEDALRRLSADSTVDLLTILTADDRGISRSIRRVLPEDGQLLLIIDQFEELFTMVGEEQRRQFLTALSAAHAEERSQLRIVFTLRADFYDQPLRYEAIGRIVRDSTAAVLPLAADELERAIVDPAFAVGAEFEPGLVSELVADVADQPGALPMLQYALTELYDARVSGLILRRAYAEMGGISGALARTADSIWETGSADERVAIRSMFGRLVTLGEGSEDTRRRVPLVDLVDCAHAVEQYGSARLLTFDREPSTRQPTVEVAHEALIREWPRLREWIDADRDDLRTIQHLEGAAAEWDETDRSDAELYRGGRLESAEGLASDPRIGPLASEFLSESLEHRARVAAQERKTTQRLQRLLIGVGMVAFVALIAGGIAIQQRSQAREAEQAAVDVAFEAETARLVAQAEALATEDPRTAALLAVAAHARTPTPESLGALQRVLAGTGLLATMPNEQNYADVVALDDRILAIHSGGVDLLDLYDGEVDARFEQELRVFGFGSADNELNRLSGDLLDVSEDQQVAVVASLTGEVIVLDAQNLVERGRIQVGARIDALTMRPDGQRVAALDEHHELHLFSVDGSPVASTELGTWSSAGEVYESVAGAPAVPWSYELEVRSSLASTHDELVVGLEGLVTVFDWSGEETEPTTLVAFDGQPSPNAYQIHLGDHTFLTVVNGLSVGTVERPLPGGVVRSGVQFEGTLGGGTPSAVSVHRVGAEDIDVALLDGTLATFSLRTGARLDDSDNELDGVLASTFSNGTVVFVDASTIGLYSSDRGPLTVAHARPPTANTLSIAGDGSFVAAGTPGWTGETALYDRTGRLLASDPHQFAIIVDDDVFSTREEIRGNPMFRGIDRFLTLPDLESFAEINAPAATSAHEHFDKRWAAYGAWPVETQVFDIDTGEPVATIPSPSWVEGADNTTLPALTVVRFDPSGQRLLVGDVTGRAHLVDTTSWTVIDEAAMQTANIAAGNWSADGSLLATSDAFGSITIRDGTDLAPKFTLEGAFGNANTWGGGSLYFSADNRHLLTNFDGPGRLWDLETGRQIGGSFETAQGTNSGANAAEDSNVLQLVTGTDDDILVWNLDTEEWPAIACQLAGRPLSEDEWAQWGPRDQQPYDLCESIGN